MTKDQALAQLADVINWQQHDEGGVTTFEVCDHRIAPFIFASYATLAEAQADVAARTEVALAEMYVPEDDVKVMMQRELDAANAARAELAAKVEQARIQNVALAEQLQATNAERDVLTAQVETLSAQHPVTAAPVAPVQSVERSALEPPPNAEIVP